MTKILTQVTDINNHYPAFTQKTLDNRVILLEEDTKPGTLITSVQAVDEDLRENGIVRYSIDKGGYGYFEIDPATGDINLLKVVDYEDVPKFELFITAYDQGTIF